MQAYLDNLSIEPPLPQTIQEPNPGETSTNDQHIKRLNLSVLVGAADIASTIGVGRIVAIGICCGVANVSLERHDVYRSLFLCTGLPPQEGFDTT
jgi:hypothetical protein